MNSLYVILDTHTDLGLNDLLSHNLAWIKENFSVILMESVPNHLSDQQAVNYMFQVIAAGFDCSACVELQVISEEEGAFLQSPYQNDMSPEEFIHKRMTLINKMMFVSADKEQWTRFLGSLKRCDFYFRCLNEGIKLMGVERPDYQPGLFTELSLRDAPIFKTIVSILDRSPEKPVLAIAGASHGINLIANLCRIGQFSCHFIRLVTDAQHITNSPFEQFRVNILSKWKLGYAQEFQQKIIPATLPREQQSALLNTLITHYSGCALPNNLVHDFERGTVKAVL